MKIVTFLCGLVLIQCVAVVFGLPYTKDSGVITLTKSNFAEQVFGSEHVWIVEFYAPWCGHCKNLAPEYEKLAKNLKGIVKVGAVNGDDERELAGAYDIKGFPTLKIFPSKVIPNPKGSGYIKEPIDYQGQRTAAAMSEYLLNQLPNFVTAVTAKSHEKFIEGPLTKALLFTNKKEVSHMFKGLAIEFHHGIEFGAIRDTEKALVEQYKVTKFPTLVVVPKEGEPITYDGELKQDPISKFLKPFSPEKPKGEGKTGKKAPEKEKEEPKAPPRNVREEVKTQAQFESLCYDKAASCIVTLLDFENTPKEDNEKYIDIIEKINKKNGETFTFIWIDGIKHYDFAEKLNIASGFPNIVLLNQRKGAMLPYIGAFNEESIQEFLDSIMFGKARPSSLKNIPPLSSSGKEEL